MRKEKSATPGKFFITVLVAFAFALYPLAAIGQPPQAPEKPGFEKLKPVPKKPALKVPPRTFKKPVPHKPGVPPKVFKKPAPHKPVGPRPRVPTKVFKKPVPPKPEQQR